MLLLLLGAGQKFEGKDHQYKWLSRLAMEVFGGRCARVCVCVWVGGCSNSLTGSFLSGVAAVSTHHAGHCCVSQSVTLAVA